jgi:MoaA/NifB/PqqE/SkfB family radical SAM enzyme
MSQYPSSTRFKFWREHYNIVLDTTTYCNAKCPQCHRTNSSEGAKLSFQGKVTKNLPLLHVPLEKIKKGFSPNVLKKCRDINLCPTWGDHMMHKHASEIIEYFLSSDDYVTVSVNTNGSMRDEMYWWNMCAQAVKYKSKYGIKRLRITFDIDGINQEMHNLYRRNTNLQKVLNHIKVCSEFKDYVRIQTQTVLFKHNQEHLKEIEDLCKSYGSESHSSVISDRFYDYKQSEDENTYHFYDENNKKLTLHRVTDEWTDNFKKKGALVTRGNGSERTEKPTCGWSLTNAVNINFDGNVWPCCFFGNVAIMDKSRFIKQHKFIEKYYNYNNNIYETDLEDILNNDWWKELPYVIESDNPVKQCIRQCTKRVQKGQLRLSNRL